MTAIEDRIETLQNKLKEAKAKKQRLDAKKRAKERNISREQDTRRKILVGAVYLGLTEGDDKKKKELKEHMNKALVRDDDRALFDLPPYRKRNQRNRRNQRNLARTEVDLDTPEPDAMGGVGSGINALEHPPPSALPFQHHDLALATELHQMEVVSGAHGGGHHQDLGEPTLIEHPLGL